eukprot:CAMPEP_0206419510 /NCGR_PEP_ID=MMETSP0324_2-20121206/179_1 /ASSEMBLY_ACC=CAM_ASM_000836 /TAXON_ID=2866 /ORGANISM="Crypthecodinium cohnii, Strain Seligo" /LENGTH=54 /DNA_ID=CAMNT_0053882995 /DNA_START=189 /DNA_END=350 /DNA_ORIENTATION=-
MAKVLKRCAAKEASNEQMPDKHKDTPSRANHYPCTTSVTVGPKLDSNKAKGLLV